MCFLLSLWLAWFGYFQIRQADNPPTAYATTSILSVHIKTVAQQKGQLLVAVYSSESELRQANPALSRTVSLHTLSLGSIEFQLQPGRYAVWVTHDLNGNNKLDVNWLGIPTEPVGVSTGFKSKLRQPTFAECALTLHHTRQQIEIELERF